MLATSLGHFTITPFAKAGKHKVAARALILPRRSHHSILIALDDGFVACGTALVAPIYDQPIHSANLGKALIKA